MDVVHHSPGEIQKALATLAVNKNDVVKTADQLGLSVDVLYSFKKQALYEIEIKQIKQSRDIVGTGHTLILYLLKSDKFKQKFFSEETPLKEVTDFIVRILKMLKEYQEVLGFTAIDIQEAINEIPSSEKGRRKAQEDGFDLIGEEEETGEVKSIDIKTENVFAIEGGAGSSDVK